MNSQFLYRLPVLMTLILPAVPLSQAPAQSPPAESAGRQQIRAAVAVAIADGKLSAVERFSILQQGKRVLSVEDQAKLKRGLDRAVVQKGTPSTARTLGTKANESLPAEPYAEKSAPAIPPAHNDPDDVRPARLVVTDEPAPAENIPPGLPLEPAEQSTNPFRDEPVFTREDPVAMPPGEPVGVGQIESCDDPALGGTYLPPVDCSPDIRLWTSVDAFKSPLDLDNHNGNFGVRFAVNAGFPVAPRRGIGVQAGTSGVLADFHGTPFTGSEIRSQNFTTVGMFQRVPLWETTLKYGFAFDWLTDDYYALLRMSQWRVKLAWELDPCNEIGIWSSIPNDGDSVRFRQGTEPASIERFKPFGQGNLYYSHGWCSGATTTTWLGIADEPGQFVFGGDARVPLTARLSLVGNATYILPSASGPQGQEEEVWNVSLGLEFRPGWRGNHCLSPSPFTPLLPLADNGSFAVRRFN